ncbi:MAG: prolipoprotein diacylglyceryl transferase [Candidatus Altimarinota bacterium]
MFPILLQIGPITIFSLWLFVCLGFFISIVFINKLTHSRRVKLNFLANNSLLLFFTGLIFARLFFVILNYNYYLSEASQGNFLEMFYIWDKGLSFWGGLVGLITSLYILCKRQDEDFNDWTDVLSVSIIFAMAIGSIGAFLDGRNYGVPSELPWAVLMESSLYAIPIHPVQLYSAIYCLIIGLVLYKSFNTNFLKESGNITLAAISSYSFFRFLEEFLRGDEAIHISIIRLPQILAILIFLASTYFLYRKYQQYKTSNF